MTPPRKAPTRKRAPSSARAFVWAYTYWSGIADSNRHANLGRVVCYRYINPAIQRLL